MDAENIDIRTGAVLASPAAPTTVAAAITAAEGQADALLEELADPLAEVSRPASVGGIW